MVSTNGFRAIPLPGLDSARAKRWIDQDLTIKDGKNNKRYLQFLSWLWRECVRLVLDELQYHSEHDADCLPRVRWVGAGLASSFPFHAAIDSSAGLTESAYYRVLSSYAPSIRALMYSRGRISTNPMPSTKPQKLLVVAMASTPGANNLPGVDLEKCAEVEALGHSAYTQILEQPDVASVLHQIQQCRIAHFAYHGVLDPSYPSESGLLLQTATAEPRQDILSVRKVSRTHLNQGKIAYLSACSTAENRSSRLVDEVLHVVSGFQVAGFRHVIGCLWPSNDKVYVEIAKPFYSELGQLGGVDYEDRAVALALRKAVAKVCESKEYGKRPLRWAQYVHYGA